MSYSAKTHSDYKNNPYYVITSHINYLFLFVYVQRKTTLLKNWYSHLRCSPYWNSLNKIIFLTCLDFHLIYFQANLYILPLLYEIVLKTLSFKIVINFSILTLILLWHNKNICHLVPFFHAQSNHSNIFSCKKQIMILMSI